MDIRGHLCEGLKKYQEFSIDSCIPKFTQKGFTQGCHDDNLIPIIYCPFCGEKLSNVILYKCKCEDCKYEYETYDEDKIPYYCEECGSNKIIATSIKADFIDKNVIIKL